jgi:nucleotide-binding universal stress UspA family protein
MKIKRILCPIDYSMYSKAANYYASLFADASGAQIIYLNVNWPPTNVPVEDRLDDLFTKLSTEVRPFVHDVRHKFEVRNGDPPKEILKLAKDQNVDLIVMGTLGATGVTRLLQCLRQGNAKCKVSRDGRQGFDEH